MKSKVIKIGGKHFRYDFDGAVVEYVTKATEEDYKDNEEFPGLWDIDGDGWIVADSVGLSKKNWSNKEAREEYLGVWSDEIDEETSYLTDQFLRFG